MQKRASSTGGALSVKDEETLIASVGYGNTTAQVLSRAFPGGAGASCRAREGALRKLLRRVSADRTGGVR